MNMSHDIRINFLNIEIHYFHLLKLNNSKHSIKVKLC